MPNHETNSVVIIGPVDKIRAFVAEGMRDLASGENPFNSERPDRVIDFALIVPEPEGIERGGCTGQHAPGVVCWYEWNTSNWGTKWGAYAHTHYELRYFQEWGSEEPYGRIDLRFQTAWSQPRPIFEAIEARWGLSVHAVTQDEGGYPDVTFGEPLAGRLAVRYEFESWDEEVTKQVAP